MKKVYTLLKIILGLITLSGALLSTGCSKGDAPKSDALVLTVDASKVYMGEMMYHVLLSEMQGKLYESFVGSGDSYWDMKNDDGSTMREAAKAAAMDNAVKYELFYKLGTEKGYALTTEEQEDCLSKAQNIKKNLPKDVLDKYGLTEEKLAKIQSKIAIATKYYDNYMKELGVDEASVKASIDAGKYKQYDIQYIYAQKKDYDTLSALKDKTADTENITELTAGTALNSGSLSFLEGADIFGEESNLEDVIKTMKAGEVSDIIKTVKGYYIIKLVSNTSTDKYDEAVKKAVDKADSEAFEPAYAKLKKEHHIKIEKKVWSSVTIGSNL